jgi:Papain-like cysteine protease AvrRpt2
MIAQGIVFAGLLVVMALLALIFRRIDGALGLAVSQALERVLVLLGGLPVSTLLAQEGGASMATTTQPWLTLDALPAWSQRQAILPDGNLDPQAYNDCGETCCSMVIASVHGCPVNPGSVRASIGGPSRSGLTTCTDLVQAFAYYHVDASCQSDRAAVAWKSIQAILATERPAIMLGTWPTPGGFLHWMIATAIEGTTIHYINPWGGVRSTLSQVEFNRLFAGSVVAVGAHLHYDMSQHPMPA